MHRFQDNRAGPTVRDASAPRILPIKSLNPYQSRWTVKARVTVKSEMRHYHNARGDGKLFNFDMLDATGGEIRAVAFNDTADKFFDIVEPGHVYTVSKGSLKPKRAVRSWPCWGRENMWMRAACAQTDERTLCPVPCSNSTTPTATTRSRWSLAR